MNEELISKVQKTVLGHDLIGRSQGVVAAVSGGPDSVAMLHILKELAESLNFWIVSAHLDHGLRPEAEDEALFVREMCENIGIAHYSTNVDVRRIAKEIKFSVEHAGRIARYEYLEKVRAEVKADLIATAHHRGDKIETFLLRLLKGSSVQGLHGIAMKRGKLIRPMIGTKKEEILDFLNSRNIEYVTDKTNFINDTDRNYVRNRIIPVIERGFQGYESPLERTIDLVGKENAFLDKLAQEAYEKGVSHIDKHAIQFNIDTLRSMDAVILSRLLIKGLYGLGGQNLRIRAKHIESIMNLIKKDGPERYLLMPGNIVARVSGVNFQLLLEFENSIQSQEAYEITVKEPGVYSIGHNDVEIEFLMINNKSRIPELLKTDETKAYFDADAVRFPFIIRPRRHGDRISPWNFNGSKKVKDLMIEARYPVSLRSIWPLVIKDDQIIWIPGIRRSNVGGLTKDSDKAILMIIRRSFIESGANS